MVVISYSGINHLKNEVFVCIFVNSLSLVEQLNKIRKMSLDYADILKVFTPHHEGHCCTDVIVDHLRIRLF